MLKDFIAVYTIVMWKIFLTINKKSTKQFYLPRVQQKCPGTRNILFSYLKPWFTFAVMSVGMVVTVCICMAIVS